MSAVKLLCFLFILSLISRRGYSQDPIPPVGQWRDHLPYHSAIDLAEGNGFVYCATPYSFFTVDLSENSVNRFSRINGLNETGVSHLAYNVSTEKLLIAYQNSNLDMIYRNDVFNIPDIKIDNITGDKTIYNIYPLSNRFYLSSGLGVIVIDADKYEVSDTWFISNTGDQVKINGFTAVNSFYYAATEEGLKGIPSLGSDPANYLNWQLLSGQNGLPAGPCEDITSVQSKLIALVNDSVYVQNGSNWNLFFAEAGWNIPNLNVSSGKILICQTRNDGSAKLTSLNADGSVSMVLQQAGLTVKPKKAVFINNEYWVADSISGMTRFKTSGIESYNLNSSYSAALGEVLFGNETFYAASGELLDDWTGTGNKNGIYSLKETQWTNYNNRVFPVFDSLPDIISLALDPRDASIWAGSYGGGLLHILQNNRFEIFKQNSPIGAPVFDPGSYRVSGLAFDKDNNLWITNYGVSQNIVIRKTDGSWKTISPPIALIENAAGQILIDDENQKWIISPKGNGLLCFNDGGTIDNTGDDNWKLYRTAPGNGNLPSINVLSLAKDKNGFIWIGTDDGIGVVQCPQNVFSSFGCDAVLPVVEQGGFNQFLFKGEQVNCIAVDGADRKWIGTKNGAWMINSDGEKVIYHFNEINSPLLSNDIRKIAIDGKTGEIFFATAKGLCSFRSTATEGSDRNENVLVFPNPVPPGYNGSIVIRGLVNNAIVKITELDGRLVYQTRALGGQAIWNGRNYRGNKVAAGVYLVLVSDDGRKENLVTKIVFINP